MTVINWLWLTDSSQGERIKMTTRQNVAVQLNRVLISVVVLLIGLQLIDHVSTLNPITVVAPTPSGESTIAATAQAICTATVRARLLNQRDGPGESYNVIGGATRGEVFSVNVWDESKQWLLASTASGSAWMSSRYLTLSGSCGNLPVNDSIASRPIQADAAVMPVPTTAVPRANVEIPSTPSISTASGTTLSAVFTAEVQFWEPQIMAWTAAYQLDANLIATVIQIESCGNASIRSSAGAQGLFQVMPFHFATGEDMLDVETNARRGLTYLQGALRLAKGNAGLALVGYNGGYGAINGNWATETRNYYYWGSGIYAEANSGMTVSPTLQEWLAAGGANLCTSARRSQQ
jgi:hypothetical protein